MTDYVTQEQLNQRLIQEREFTRQAIDTAVAASNIAQSERWGSLKIDLQSTVADTVTRTVRGFTTSIEDRLARYEESQQTQAQITAQLRRDLYGAPDERSGQSSIFEMLQQLLENDRKQDGRLAHYDALEQAGFKLVHLLVTGIRTFVGAKIIRLLPLIAAMLVTACGSAAFYLAFLARFYR